MTAQEFNDLIDTSQPHPIFKTDWGSYSSMDFADTFLPKVLGYKGEAHLLFDGGALFKGVRASEKKLLGLTNDNNLINIIGYTYPNEVAASENLDKARPAKNELLLFFEVEVNDSVTVHFRSGTYFLDFLKNMDSRKGLQNIQKTHTTKLSSIRDFFDGKLTHQELMRYAFEVLELGITPEIVTWNLSLESYLHPISFFGKYKPTIIVKKTQREVIDAKKNPRPDEIFIYLVRRENGKFEEDFIIIEFGKDVARDFKDRKVTEKYIKQIVIDAIALEVGPNTMDQKAINNQVPVFLNRAELASVIAQGLENDPAKKKIFLESPIAYFAIETLGYYSKELKQYKLASHRWKKDSKNPEYNPLIPNDHFENAVLCGVINGLIDYLADLLEAVAFFYEMTADAEKFEEMVEGIKQLLKEENLLELLFLGLVEGYLESDTPWDLGYQLGRDLIEIVAFLVGIITFFEGGGIATFLKGIKNVLNYLKRFGKKGITRLKKLNKKQLKEVFEEIEGEVSTFEIDELYRNKTNKDDGGISLTRNELLKLKENLEKRFSDFNLKVEIVSNNPKFRKMLQRWKQRNTQGVFRSGPPPKIFVRQNCTQLTMQHEVWHMEDLKKLGQIEYKKIPDWKHEESVWNKIWSTKHRWADEELVDSYWYYKRKTLVQGGEPVQVDEMDELLKLYPERLKQ